MSAYESAADALLQLEAERAAAVQRADDTAQIAATLEQERDAARQELADHMAEHHGGPEPEPTGLTRIGMSAPANLWDQRLREVGPEGVTARRIFCTEMSIRGRIDEIRDAIATGMLPVLSFKGTPTAANVSTLRAELEQLDTDVTATWHHEPRGDWSGAEFCRHSETFLGVASARVKVGPILNGFLLNNQRTMPEWETFSTAALLDAWDFIGVDLYQREGGAEVPGSQIPKMNAWLDSKGHAGMEVLVGEYNSFDATSIAAAGETFLSTPNVKVACVWNSTGKPGSQEHTPLAGDRLTAYQATKADARAAR